MDRMIKLAKCFMAAALLVGATNAQAVIFDFKAAANGSYGESAWASFDLSTFGVNGVNVQISAVKTDIIDPFVYLDSGDAGMGVCGSLNSTGIDNVDTKRARSTTNLCSQSDDDNVTSGESLSFAFNEAVVISKIWFNNNHDGDKGLLDDIIVIFGTEYVFTAIDSSRGNDAVYVPVTPNSFAAGKSSVISYFDVGETSRSGRRGEEFYLSAIEINRVPEPAMLALLSVALAGVGFSRRRKMH